MEEKKPEEVQEQGGLRWILKRWAGLSAQLRCPACGTGRLPETRFCVNCGAELPAILREDTPAVAEQKRPSRRALNWLIDLVPGILSPKVVAASLAAFVLSIAGTVVALRILSGVGSGGSLGAVLIFLFQVCPIAFVSALTYLFGLGWLLCGKLCPLWEAVAEFRLKHLLLAFVLAVLGFRVVLWLL